MDSAENVCLVCHEGIEIFAIGKCDHPICYKCSTRMRALCEQLYCPICRTDLPEVFFMMKIEKFGEMPIRKFITNRKFKIQFENEHVRQKFEELLEHKCKICKDRYPEKSFKALRDHMRRVHTLFFCDLCLELKIFTSDRKLYDRKALGEHRRVGDKDDTSYKGHPLCKFCDERYLDNDELYKHLRKDHYYCHFCESLGSQEFFADYDFLRDHFQKEHYLCEEGDCATVQFENAFRSEIDLKSHVASRHSKAQSKHQARQERTLNIDINLAPRPSNRPQRGQSGRYDHEDGSRGQGQHRPQGGRGGGRYNRTQNREQEDIDRAIQASLSTMKEEKTKKEKKVVPKPVSDSSSEEEYFPSAEHFPTLGNVPTTAQPLPSSTLSSVSTTAASASDSYSTSLADRFAISNNMSVQHGVLGARDFPTLKSSSKPSVSKSVQPVQAKGGRNSPYKPNVSAKTIEEDFPELPVTKRPSSTTLGSWTKPGVVSQPSTNLKSQQQTAKPPSQQVNPRQNNNLSNEEDFPSLGPAAGSSVPSWTSKKSFKARKDDSFDEDSNKPISERFSPVNVPGSPVNDKKTKNKKKKKKEKTVKNEQETVKENSSLDDIANLLMSNVSNSPEPSALKKPDPVKEVVEKQNAVNDKTQAKKKTDNVEKKLEAKVENKKDEIVFNFETKSSIAKSVPLKNKEDFPVLGKASASAPSKKPPPGFSDGKRVPASSPPGFTVPSKPPPPGFASQKLSDVSKEMFPQNTITSNDTTPMSINSANFTYQQPFGFSDRNKALVSNIQTACGTQDNFNDFKKLSVEYRTADITAEQYYNKCQKILGKDNFVDIFPELLALLPDIDKQQDLLSVYMMLEGMRKDDGVLKISGKSRNAKGAWTMTQSGFLTCQTCRQVLVRRDYNEHVASHNLDSDYPTLGGSDVGKTGWKRIK